MKKTVRNLLGLLTLALFALFAMNMGLGTVSAAPAVREEPAEPPRAEEADADVQKEIPYIGGQEEFKEHLLSTGVPAAQVDEIMAFETKIDEAIAAGVTEEALADMVDVENARMQQNEAGTQSNRTTYWSRNGVWSTCNRAYASWYSYGGTNYTYFRSYNGGYYGGYDSTGAGSKSQYVWWRGSWMYHLTSSTAWYPVNHRASCI